MLTAIFKNILGITLSLTPIILLLLAINPLLQKRYSPKLRYFVWLFVAVRLLLPVSFQDAARIFIPAGEAIYYLPNDSTAVARAFAEAEATAIGTAPAHNIQPVASQVAISWIGIFAMIWIVGALVYLISQVASYFTIQHRFSRWSIPIHNAAMNDIFDEIRQELGIQKKIELYQSEQISSPLLIGFINPRIIIPTITAESTHLRAILRHELLHYRRADLWYKALMLLVVSLHWFNPAVYLMAKHAEADMELACDSEVLKGTDKSFRKEYGLAILSIIPQEKASRIPLTTYFFSSKKQLKQRFVEIADTGVKRKGMFVFCALAVISILAGTLVGCGYLVAPTSEQYNSNQPSIHVAEQEVRTDNLGTQQELSPLSSDEESPRILDSDSLDLEQKFLDDLEDNQAMQEKLKQEIDDVYRRIEWTSNAYSGGQMAWPLPGYYYIAYAYGWRFSGRDFHTGIDISGMEIYGQPVVSASDGTVVYINSDYAPGEGYGIHMIVDHGGGISTLYAQLSEVTVSLGDSIAKGQIIAEVGSTGWSTEPHLHFEVRVDGESVNPQPYLTVLNGFMWPTDGGEISADLNSFPGHTGIDIARPEGTPVYAAAAGTVTEAKNATVGYGKHIRIDHGDGYETIYAHNSELYVSVGDFVDQGEVIAAVGRSGNTTDNGLHFEIRHNGQIVNPQDYITS